jgi:hypothetical protein
VGVSRRLPERSGAAGVLRERHPEDRQAARRGNGEEDRRRLLALIPACPRGGRCPGRDRHPSAHRDLVLGRDDRPQRRRNRLRRALFGGSQPRPGVLWGSRGEPVPAAGCRPRVTCACWPVLPGGLRGAVRCRRRRQGTRGTIRSGDAPRRGREVAGNTRSRWSRRSRAAPARTTPSAWRSAATPPTTTGLILPIRPIVIVVRRAKLQHLDFRDLADGQERLRQPGQCRPRRAAAPG